MGAAEEVATTCSGRSVLGYRLVWCPFACGIVFLIVITVMLSTSQSYAQLRLDVPYLGKEQIVAISQSEIACVTMNGDIAHLNVHDGSVVSTREIHGSARLLGSTVYYPLRTKTGAIDRRLIAYGSEWYTLSQLPLFVLIDNAYHPLSDSALMRPMPGFPVGPLGSGLFGISEDVVLLYPAGSWENDPVRRVDLSTGIVSLDQSHWSPTETDCDGYPFISMPPLEVVNGIYSATILARDVIHIVGRDTLRTRLVIADSCTCCHVQVSQMDIDGKGGLWIQASEFTATGLGRSKLYHSKDRGRTFVSHDSMYFHQRFARLDDVGLLAVMTKQNDEPSLYNLDSLDDMGRPRKMTFMHGSSTISVEDIQRYHDVEALSGRGVTRVRFGLDTIHIPMQEITNAPNVRASCAIVSDSIVVLNVDGRLFRVVRSKGTVGEIRHGVKGNLRHVVRINDSLYACQPHIRYGFRGSTPPVWSSTTVVGRLYDSTIHPVYSYRRHYERVNDETIIAYDGSGDRNIKKINDDGSFVTVWTSTPQQEIRSDDPMIFADEEVWQIGRNGKVYHAQMSDSLQFNEIADLSAIYPPEQEIGKYLTSVYRINRDSVLFAFRASNSGDAGSSPILFLLDVSRNAVTDLSVGLITEGVEAIIAYDSRKSLLSVLTATLRESKGSEYKQAVTLSQKRINDGSQAGWEVLWPLNGIPTGGGFLSVCTSDSICIGVVDSVGNGFVFYPQTRSIINGIPGLSSDLRTYGLDFVDGMLYIAADSGIVTQRIAAPVTSVNGLDQHRIHVTVSPLPVSNQLSIKVYNSLGNQTLTATLYDIHGQRVESVPSRSYRLSDGEYTLDPLIVGSLPTGVYILECSVPVKKSHLVVPVVR